MDSDDTSIVENFVHMYVALTCCKQIASRAWYQTFMSSGVLDNPVQFQREFLPLVRSYAFERTNRDARIVDIFGNGPDICPPGTLDYLRPEVRDMYQAHHEHVIAQHGASAQGQFDCSADTKDLWRTAKQRILEIYPELHIKNHARDNWAKAKLVPRLVGAEQRARERAYAPGGIGYEQTRKATLVGKPKKPKKQKIR